MDLSLWMVIWVVVTTAVVVLAYFRLTYGLHDILGVRFGAHAQEFFEEKEKVEHRMDTLDKVGILLTALSVLLALGLVLAWFYKP